MNKSALKETMQEGSRLRLWNGLSAQLYRLDNPLVRDVANACLHPPPQRIRILPYRRCCYHALVVEVAGEKVSIVYLNEDTLNIILKTTTKGRINPWIHRDFFVGRIIVYNGTAHYYDHTAKLLEAAITKKVKPSLSALVFQDKLKEET